MGIFALGLAFDAGQAVRSASVTLRDNQLHDLCGHRENSGLFDEQDKEYCEGRIMKI